MNYTMTKPCPKCPFRTDVDPYLNPERVEEIADALQRGGEFQCHQTLEYGEESEDGEAPVIRTEKDQHCAGALIVLEKMEQPHQMMRICERLGMYNPRRLDMDAPVYDSLDDMIDAYEDATT